MDAKDRLKLNSNAPQFGSGLYILGLIEIAGLNETRWKGYGARVLASYFERSMAMLTLKQAHFLLKSGVSLELLELASSIHHLDARELSIAEARRFNLINID
jgi:hypothetical protein